MDTMTHMCTHTKKKPSHRNSVKLHDNSNKQNVIIVGIAQFLLPIPISNFSSEVTSTFSWIQIFFPRTINDRVLNYSFKLSVQIKRLYCVYNKHWLWIRCTSSSKLQKVTRLLQGAGQRWKSIWNEITVHIYALNYRSQAFFSSSEVCQIKEHFFYWTSTLDKLI